TPFGVFGATTWLNLMTIGDCAEAGPTRASAATDAAAKINLRIYPPALFLAERAGRCSGRCMPAASIQRSRPKGHCPLAGATLAILAAAQNATFCPLHPKAKRGGEAPHLLFVIPGHAKREPGISRSRVRCFASPRDDGANAPSASRRGRHVALAFHDDLVERAQIGFRRCHP